MRKKKKNHNATHVKITQIFNYLYWLPPNGRKI